MRIPSNLVTFSGGNTKLYEQFADYWKHFLSPDAKDVDTSISFAEKEEKMNATLLKEIMRVAGVQNMEGLPKEAWVTNPMINWATFAVVNALVDYILPETLVQSIGMFADIRSGNWGDSFSFQVSPRDLFAVSKAGKAQRMAELHKQFDGSVTVLPEMREISVQVSLMRVLQGKESLAAFVMKAARSIESHMSVEAYNLFETTMAALPTTATTGLKSTGYTAAALVDKCQRVTAWAGQKAIVVGTQLALANVLPDDANYRYTLDSEYVKLGYVRTAFGFDLLALPQVADWTTPWGTVISDNYLWILAPTAGKFVKVCLEGSTLSNTTGAFDAANLVQSTTLFKSYGLGVATSTVAATIQLQ